MNWHERFRAMKSGLGLTNSDIAKIQNNNLKQRIMTKKELGKQIEALRKECGVSTYKLEKMGIHPSLPGTIEKGKKGYSMDSLIKYLHAIDEDIFLSVGKK